MDPKVVADEFADYRIEDFDWINRLEKFILEAREDNKIPVIVALARKMQRFLKWCHTSDRCLLKEKILKLHIYDESQTVLITEHAIPIVIPECKPETHSIVILDDLIIYGNSIEIVAENIYYYTGIKPSYIAMGKTERALSIPFATDFGIGTPVIYDKDLSLFTTRNSLAILSLQHPIDLEYCILSFKLGESQTNTIRQFLLEYAKKVFPAPYFAVYETKHTTYGKDCSNVTICKLTDDNTLFYHNSDFNKLRIFVSSGEIKIVSYAPNILYENELSENSSLFSGTDFADLWRIVYQKIENNTNAEEGLDPNSFWEGIVRKEYEHRKQLTKVIWANYLSSYNNILCLKGKINNLLTMLGVKCNPKALQDLKLLIGSKLGNVIDDQLIRLYETENVRLLADHYADQYIANAALIPEEFKEAYDSENSLRAYYSTNIREALSHIFTNMHHAIGLPRITIKDSHILARRRFGECFNSLYSFLSEYFSSTQYESRIDIIIDIHKWVDEKVDMGIVIPKYESNIDQYGRNYWKRYFRAGENDDSYIKLARLCAKETSTWLKEQKRSTFTKQEFISKVLVDIIDNILVQSNEEIFSLKDFMQHNINTNITADRVSQKIWSYLLNLRIFAATTTIYNDTQEYIVDYDRLVMLPKMVGDIE